MLAGMLRVLVVGLVVLVVAMMLINRQNPQVPEPSTATVLPEPRSLPAVQLRDKSGNAFATSDFAGHYTLLFFGFTNCPDICPITLSVLAEVRAELRARQPALAPQVAFVSVDPYRDTPEAIADYLEHFDPQFIGLTAPDDVLAPLLDALGVSVHKTETEGERYNVVHNGTVYVLDADGRWIAIFGGSEHDARTIATDFLRIRRRHEAGRVRAPSAEARDGMVAAALPAERVTAASPVVRAGAASPVVHVAGE